MVVFRFLPEESVRPVGWGMAALRWRQSLPGVRHATSFAPGPAGLPLASGHKKVLPSARRQA